MADDDFPTNNLKKGPHSVQTLHDMRLSFMFYTGYRGHIEFIIEWVMGRQERGLDRATEPATRQ